MHRPAGFPLRQRPEPIDQAPPPSTHWRRFAFFFTTKQPRRWLYCERLGIDPANTIAERRRSTKPRDWLEQTREDWADQANEALDRAGWTERINEASFETQYFEAAENGDEREMARLQNREPGVHIGPHNVARAERGVELDWVADAAEVEERNRVGLIEEALAFVEQKISELTERIAERVRETWKPNRPSIEHDRGPDIDWSR